MAFITEAISQEIWNAKYRYRYNGQTLDNSIEQTWSRVASAIAGAESLKQRSSREAEFYQLMEGFKFLPGGRILAGAGTEHDVTLFNCFVMNIAKDSLAGIFSALKEGAMTLQEGGGVGYDFSVLRPKGDLAKRTGLFASGPVSFMKIWDTTCGILLSTGARRGAMMGVLRCDHPDIDEFINAKKDKSELRHFNVSVLVSDAFMQAVKTDSDWNLCHKRRVYKTIKARDLWARIIQSAYDYAEPGVLFEDTINRLNNLYYCERISATNPCGEIPLPPYGACNLGSLNLTQFVTQPFTANAKINWSALESCIESATRFLDNVIDVSRYPLKRQQAAVLATRRIGLGLTGLANVFVMLGLRYGSDESLTLASQMMKRIAEVTWMTSCELAKERGSFLAFDKQSYLRGEFVTSLSTDIQLNIQKYGMRNSHHYTIAPTGTTSLLANNISSGLEPIFHDEYTRYVLMPDNSRQKFSVVDYALQSWRSLGGEKLKPLAWVDSQQLTPDEHLNMQCAVQPYVDNAISKTINLPHDFPFDQLSDVYTRAYEMGLKGCTIFRPNAVTGSVLEVTPPEDDAEQCCQLA